MGYRKEGPVFRSATSTLLSTVIATALVLTLVPVALADGEDTAPVEVRRELTKKWGRPGPVYDMAVRLAKKGQYENAILLLTSLKRNDDPRVLNYLGFATRKSGDPDGAIPFYEKALALEPGFTQARQYLGEAWLQLQQTGLAEEQLAEIKKHCGENCDDYRKLAQMIDAHAAGKPVNAGW